MITNYDDIQFEKILAQFNDMYGRLNIIEDMVLRIKPPPKENPAKVNSEVVSKRTSEQLKECLSECKVLSEQLRNTVNLFAEFKADVYKKVEDLNNKYETDLKQIRSDVTYKIADLKREITKFNDREIKAIKVIFDKEKLDKKAESKQ